MKKVILFVLFVLFVCGCNETKQQKQRKTYRLGSYVYVDDDNILHIDMKCRGIAKTHGAQSVSIVSVNDVDEYMLKYICSVCCDESVYEKLKEKVEKDEKNLKDLYAYLLDDNYDLPDYDTFKKDLEDEKNMKDLHACLLDDNYDLPDYDTFRKDLGYGGNSWFPLKKIRDFLEEHVRSIKIPDN